MGVIILINTFMSDVEVILNNPGPSQYTHAWIVHNLEVDCCRLGLVPTYISQLQDAIPSVETLEKWELCHAPLGQETEGTLHPKLSPRRGSLYCNAHSHAFLTIPTNNNNGPIDLYKRGFWRPPLIQEKAQYGAPGRHGNVDEALVLQSATRAGRDQSFQGMAGGI